MAVLDNDIWLTGAGGTAESGSTILTEGGHSTTVTGSFTAGAWDASQSGYGVSDFGAFGVSEPITATFDFSNPVTDLSFDLQHVNSSGNSYDDKFTLTILDASGTLVPAAEVIAGLTGVTHQIVTVNPDGTVSIEGEGSTAGDIGISVAGPVSSLSVTYEDGDDAPLSGGSGISDLSFTIPPELDYVVEGTSGNDLIDADYLGDPEGDRVDNNDALDGSQDDVIEAGDGNDTVLAGDGDDSVEAGDGDDSVVGGEGNDTLRGGWGDDTIHGGESTDTLWGGTGKDTLAGSQGDDEIHAGADDDLVFIGVGEGSDSIYLDEGNDFLDGGSADSSFYGEGGAGNDNMNSGAGADTLLGGTGKDTMDGGAGADSLEGGTGDDSITGGSGNDTLIGGDGADTLSGGDDFDILDLSDVGPALVHYDPDDAEAGTIEFLDDDGNVIHTLDFVNIEKVVGATVPCFTPGTTILTPQGEIPVELLNVGDEVVTLDHGAQPLRWIGTREVTAAELALHPHFNPVCIARDALAPGVPARDLTVSPQHRMLIEGAQSEMLFGTSEVLAAALNLANDSTILRQRPQGVTYIHLLFDTHEIIYANGAWSESFQPGAATIAGMEEAQRQELLSLFPELADHREPFAAARLSLKSYEAALLEI